MKTVAGLGLAIAIVLLSTTAAMLAPRDPQCRPVHGPDYQSGAAAFTREHVRQDMQAVEAEAARFGQDVATRPLLSDSIDAREGARTAPTRATAWCRTTLIASLAAAHRTTEAALLAAAASANQADADRTSRAASASPVVSRPSR